MTVELYIPMQEPSYILLEEHPSVLACQDGYADELSIFRDHKVLSCFVFMSRFHICDL